MPKRVVKDRLTSDTRPLYLQVVDLLLDWFGSESLQAGDALPGEPDLAQIFDVGRSTIREALVYLEHEGVIERSQGFRTILTSLVQRPAMGLEVLDPVEALAERQGWRCETSDVSIVQSDASADQARQLHINVGSPVTIITRTKSINKKPFAVMISVMSEKAVPFSLLRRDFVDSLTRLLGDSRTLRFAEATFSALSCPDNLAESLAVEVNSPLVVLEELFYGDEEFPIAWNLNYLVPNTIRLQLLRKAAVRHNPGRRRLSRG